MNSVLSDLQANWPTYAMIPVIAAVIGYVTKLAAVEMLFRPLEFKGIPPFLGWQGIIPRYAPRMAEVAIDLMLTRLLKPQEIIEKIDPAELLERLHDPLYATVDEMMREIMIRYQPGLWESLPEFVRTMLISRAQDTIPSIVSRMTNDLRTNIDSVLDLKPLAVNALTREPAVLVRLMRNMAKDVLSFFVIVGIPFGFILGLAQLTAWALTHNIWIMPAFGALTGLITDWLALQMIFRPIKPKKYFGVFKWQGLFHKLRDQVTNDYSELVANEVLTPSNIIEGVLDGPSGSNVFELVLGEVQKALDSQLGIARPVAVLAIGGREYQAMKRDIATTAIARMRAMQFEVESYARETLDLKALMVTKMSQFTDDEFEGLLRPAFKQDEWKIITVGAILGFLVGELQVHLLLQ